MTKIVGIVIGLCSFVFAQGISGIYLTHKGTQGGQSIVEIFELDGKYHIYGLKNLDSEPIKDSCNKDSKLRDRKSVGTVFGFNYKANESGDFVGGKIYNFYNCKTYYGKIVKKGNDEITFIGALDSHYILRRSFRWKLLNEEEAKHYQVYRKKESELKKSLEDTIRTAD